VTQSSMTETPFLCLVQSNPVKEKKDNFHPISPKGKILFYVTDKALKLRLTREVPNSESYEVLTHRSRSSPLCCKVSFQIVR
jgi:hypothetical protein